MAAASDYLEGQIRAHIFRTGTFTKPSVLAIALCTAAPTDADTGALTAKEVANAGAYARQTLNPLDANWAAASATDGLTDNASAITFPTATAAWGTVTHVAICDSATYGAGNLLFHGALTTSKVVGINDVFSFAIGALDVTIA
jgi:hypothetical protein